MKLYMLCEVKMKGFFILSLFKLFTSSFHLYKLQGDEHVSWLERNEHNDQCFCSECSRISSVPPFPHSSQCESFPCSTRKCLRHLHNCYRCHTCTHNKFGEKQAQIWMQDQTGGGAGDETRSLKSCRHCNILAIKYPRSRWKTELSAGALAPPSTSKMPSTMLRHMRGSTTLTSLSVLDLRGLVHTAQSVIHPQNWMPPERITFNLSLGSSAGLLNLEELI